MKKIIYMFSLILALFVVYSPKVSAESKVKLSLDLEYHDTFNLFYELKEATPLAEILVENGDNLKGYLLKDYINTNSYNFSYYYIRLYYANECSIESVENATYCIQFRHFGTYGGNPYNQYSLSTYFFYDNDMNFIKYVEGSRGDRYYTSVTYDDVFDIYHLTNFYEGNMTISNTNLNITYVLASVTENGNTYKVNDKYSLFDQLIEKITKKNVMYEDLERKEFNLSWYAENVVISKSSNLHYSHDTLFNLSKIDLGEEWTKINVTDYENGLYLVPKVTSVSEGDSGNLYYYTTSKDVFLKGALVHFDEVGTASTNIAYALNSNQGKMTLTLINQGTFKNADNKMAVVSSNVDGETKWYKYAFYFTSSNIIDSVYLFYDSDIYDLKVVDSTGYVTLVDIETGTSNNINSSTIKSNMNTYIASNDIHSGGVDTKYPSGVPMSWIDNGGTVEEYYVANSSSSFDSTEVFSNAKGLVSNLNGSISGFFGVISACFESFPELLSLIYFGITAVVLLSIWHFVRG